MPIGTATLRILLEMLPQAQIMPKGMAIGTATRRILPEGRSQAQGPLKGMLTGTAIGTKVKVKVQAPPP